MSNSYVFQVLYQTLQKKNVDNPPYGKKMAAVIFTTIPFEPNTANYT